MANVPALQIPQMQSPLDAYAKVSNLQAMMQGQQLRQEQLKSAQMENANTQRAQQDEEAYRSVLEKYNGNIEQALPELSKTVSPKTYLGIQQSLLAQKKAAAEFEKLSTENKVKLLELSTKRAERIGQLAGSVTDQPTYEQSIQAGFSEGLWDEPTAKSMLARPYDPNTVKFIQTQALTAAQQQKQKLDELQFAETQKVNTATIQHQKNTEGLTARAQAEALRHNRVTEGLSARSNDIAAKTAQLKQTELQNTLTQQQISREGTADSYQRAINSLDTLYKGKIDLKTGELVDEKVHPGMAGAVGMKISPWALPGSQRANFEAQLDTLKAQTFLPMVQSLRGMGALSDAEGKKLSDAVGALSTKMSEKEFKKSVIAIRSDLEKAKARLDKFNTQSVSDDDFLRNF